jgi:hypothetical protein
MILSKKVWVWAENSYAFHWNIGIPKVLLLTRQVKHTNKIVLIILTDFKSTVWFYSGMKISHYVIFRHCYGIWYQIKLPRSLTIRNVIFYRGIASIYLQETSHYDDLIFFMDIALCCQPRFEMYRIMLLFDKFQNLGLRFREPVRD